MSKSAKLFCLPNHSWIVLHRCWLVMSSSQRSLLSSVQTLWWNKILESTCSIKGSILCKMHFTCISNSMCPCAAENFFPFTFKKVWKNKQTNVYELIWLPGFTSQQDISSFANGTFNVACTLNCTTTLSNTAAGGIRKVQWCKSANFLN